MRYVLFVFSGIVLLLIGWAAKTAQLENNIFHHFRYLEARVTILEDENATLKDERVFYRGQIHNFDKKWSKGMLDVHDSVDKREKELQQREFQLNQKTVLLDEKAKTLLKFQRELEERKKELGL